MKQHLTLTNILIVALFLFQCYLKWGISKKDDLPMLEAAQRIAEQQDSLLKQGELIIAHIDAEIGSHVDTLKVINNQKLVLREIYRSDIAKLLSNDSSQVTAQYLLDYTKSKEMLKSGEYFNHQ